MLKLKIKYSNTYIKKLYKEIVVVFNFFGHFDWFGLNLVLFVLSELPRRPRRQSRLPRNPLQHLQR